MSVVFGHWTLYIGIWGLSFSFEPLKKGDWLERWIGFWWRMDGRTYGRTMLVIKSLSQLKMLNLWPKVRGHSGYAGCWLQHPWLLHDLDRFYVCLNFILCMLRFEYFMLDGPPRPTPSATSHFALKTHNIFGWNISRRVEWKLLLEFWVTKLM